MIGSVLKKLAQERVNAIVVLPNWSRYWTAMLRSLPVTETHHISYQSGLLRFGLQVPKDYDRKFKYILKAYKVFMTPTSDNEGQFDFKATKAVPLHLSLHHQSSRKRQTRKHP
jgi:hypothetical protein